MMIQTYAPTSVGRARSCVLQLLRFSIVVAAYLFANNASAYRTGTDLDQFKGTERVRWSSNSVIFDVARTLPATINPIDFSREFVRAFSQWSNVECGGVHAEFDQVLGEPAQYGDGRNTIELVSTGWTARGYADNAAGATDIRYRKQADGQWQIVEADIYINAESFQWTTDAVPTSDARTIFSVLLHEGGHAIGLLHPCEEHGEGGAPQCKAADVAPSDSVMYPLYDPSQATLTTDDVAGVCSLYRKCESTGCPDGYECGADGCSLPCPSDENKGHCSTDEVCSRTGCVSISECAATNCLKKDSCTAAADCGLGEYCNPKGECKTGERALGDACATSSECAHSVCLNAACVPACWTDSECTGVAICEPDRASSNDPLQSGVASRGACIGPEKALGQPCRESDECLGGECLSGASADPVCTRLCGEGQPECPAPWTCTVAEGRSVCAPLGGVQGGCSVSPGATGSPRLSSTVLPRCAAALATLFVILSFRVSRRRFTRQGRGVQHTSPGDLPE
jgi:hypothetical protein